MKASDNRNTVIEWKKKSYQIWNSVNDTTVQTFCDELQVQIEMQFSRMGRRVTLN